MKYFRYFLLIGGIITIILSFISLYYNLAPRVGPIGNGPNYPKIWINFSIQLLIGLFVVATSIFIKRNN